MNSTQKIIKNLAIAFAFFLIFNIISVIVYGLSVFTYVFNDKEDVGSLEEIHELTTSNVKVLTIDLKTSNLVIKVGENFKVETSNQNIKTTQEKNKIYITERNHSWFKEKSKLIIYVPNNRILDTVTINGGAGKIKIDTFITKNLNLNLGAGKVDMNHLQVLNKTKVDGGVGSVHIKNSILNELDLDTGVGKLNIDAKVLGKSTIEQGVGSIDLNLIGTSNDYKIHVDKGIGSIRVDEKKVKDDETIGNGINKIDIDGGIGNMDINFIKIRSNYDRN